MKIINGYAGCGKTEKLCGDIEELIKNGCSSEKICILALNSNRKKYLEDIFTEKKVMVNSFNGFLNEILKKSPMMFGSKILSDYFAIQIIQSISKEYLNKDEVMKNLNKSGTFARELYNLFGLYKVNKITVDDLNSVCKKSNISKEDEVRFKITVDIYSKYCEFLKENKFLDYKDAVSFATLALQRSEFLRKNIKNKYDYIFVTDSQNLNSLQLELLEKVVSKENLILYGDSYSRTQGFMGANIFKEKEFDLTESGRNKEILERALIFVENKNSELKESESLEYRKFADFQSEMDYIAKDIIKKNEDGIPFSDIAILVRDYSVKQNIAELLRSYEFPISGEIQSEEFDSFKQKLTTFLKICNLLEKLGIAKFEYEEFEKETELNSIYDLENYSLQLNNLIKDLLNEAFSNKFYVEKLLMQKESFRERYLPVVFWKSKKILPEKEWEVGKEILFEIKKLYEKYKNNKFLQFVTEIANIDGTKDENYHKFVAKFLNNIKEMVELKQDIFKENISVEAVLELLDFTLEDNIKSENRLNLESFFKCAGNTYKYVYIPSMVEDYFPKKIKSTLFISDEANQILSTLLKEVNPDFEKIIFSEKEELEEENCLMYVAMTRASNKVFVSTHDYEGKKVVLPSQYYEQLVEQDCNFIENNDIVEKIKENKVKKDENEEIFAEEDEIVIDADETLFLSASSISNFLSCPRKFYYSNLLGLKKESNFYANYGIIVHAIFENMFENYLSEISLEKFRELGEILFGSVNNRQRAIDAGFKEKTLDKILESSPLGIEEMRKDYNNAINSCNEGSFYNTVPHSAGCEKKFEMSFDEIPNVIFNGFIDAIIDYGDKCKMLDYKTGADKNSLEKFVSEDGLNFEKDGEPDIDKIKKYDYQIPLYYLASLFSKDLEEYKDKITHVGYFYVRPPYRKKGSKFDVIPASIIKECKDKIIENIKKYVVGDIRGKTYFEAKQNYIRCRNCEYAEICELKNGNEDD